MLIVFNPAAFARLWDRLGGRLLAAARLLTGSLPEAEDALHDLFVALARGARDYCQAYHHGSIRKHALDLLMANQNLPASARAILERVPWQARDVNGRFNAASVLDIQDWFVKEGFLKTKAPIERLISTEYSDHIEKTLGPFEVENKASQMKGCR